MQDPAIKAIRQRLERWELTHLRAHVADLADRLERAESDLDRARGEAADAWIAADTWRQEADLLVQALHEDCKTVGLTQSGALVVVPSPGVDIDAAHNCQQVPA